MSLGNIPVTVITEHAPVSGNAVPVLLEIAELHKQLVASGEASAIDLTAMPLNDADKAWLKAQLGQGQVRATLEAEGTSTLEETACAGVWWVTHQDVRGQVQTELIEITRVPELLVTHPDDVAIGQEYLDILMNELD